MRRTAGRTSEQPRAAVAAPATGSASDEAFELADRLHSVAIHLVRRVRRSDSATGLAGPRLSALSVLVFGGPMTISELAAAEQVRPPTMTRIVGALEGMGLVEREGDPQDRRVVRVRATPRGIEVLEEGRRRRIDVLARALDRVSAEDQATIARALDTLEVVVGGRHWPARRVTRSSS